MRTKCKSKTNKLEIVKNLMAWKFRYWHKEKNFRKTVEKQKGEQKPNRLNQFKLS